jgi:DNA polymerase III gamma/tau subunit
MRREDCYFIQEKDVFKQELIDFIDEKIQEANRAQDLQTAKVLTELTERIERLDNEKMKSFLARIESLEDELKNGFSKRIAADVVLILKNMTLSNAEKALAEAQVAKDKSEAIKKVVLWLVASSGPVMLFLNWLLR